MNESSSTNHTINHWYLLNKFADIIKHESRYVLQEPYKSFVDSIMNYIQEHFSAQIPANSIFYRARINDVDFENRKEEEQPFPSDEMGIPPHYIAQAGRINPEGIPYLYCSDEIDTAGSELRPWKGAHLTIGEVQVNKNILIADLTLECSDDDTDWYLFFDDFSRMFSIQWPSELKLNYLVTQFFAEHLKSKGFRGIKYKSSFNNGGNNYSLFHKEDYSIIQTYCVETIEVDYCFFKKGKNTD